MGLGGTLIRCRITVLGYGAQAHLKNREGAGKGVCWQEGRAQEGRAQGAGGQGGRGQGGQGGQGGSGLGGTLIRCRITALGLVPRHTEATAPI